MRFVRDDHDVAPVGQQRMLPQERGSVSPSTPNYPQRPEFPKRPHLSHCCGSQTRSNMTGKDAIEYSESTDNTGSCGSQSRAPSAA